MPDVEPFTAPLVPMLDVLPLAAAAPVSLAPADDDVAAPALAIAPSASAATSVLSGNFMFASASRLKGRALRLRTARSHEASRCTAHATRAHLRHRGAVACDASAGVGLRAIASGPAHEYRARRARRRAKCAAAVAKERARCRSLPGDVSGSHAHGAFHAVSRASPNACLASAASWT
jgi:hypothetical protein